jgi:serine/threonine-protein kinase
MRDDLRGRLQSSLGTAYTLERELGGGGMARVFVAREEALGRDVVVKVLAPELAEGLSVERFAREIHLAAALQAPHIVPLLAAGVTGEGLPYYTMPYVRGETLRARLARGPVPPGEAMGILRDVAHALAYAHRQGVVHRDIKPENVLLHEGTAVVTDFGIAKAVGASRTRAPERTAATLTRTGTSLGTPAYMAPEQAVGDEVDARADLYAWGVLAFEVLAGAHPFAGRTSAAQLVHAHITEAPPALALRAPAVAPPLAATVMRCLAKDPAARFASADELLRSLDDGAAPSSGPRGRRVASRRALLLAGGLALSAAIGALWWKRAPHPAVDEQRIAVLPFRVATADPSLRYLREGMLDLVAAKLSGDQRAVDQRAVLARWRAAGGSETVDPDPARARAFVEQLGAGRLLQGEVIAVGGSEAVTLSAELLAVPGGRRRASARATGAPQAIAALVDSVVNALLALDAGDDAQRANSLAAIPYPALEVYLRGQRAYRHGDYGAASESFEHALRTDSSFVLAGLMLGRTAGWVLDRRTSRIAERVVRQYRDRLGRNDRVLADASYPDSVHTSCAERLAAYRRATELAPDLPEAWYSLGDQTFHCGGAVYGDVGAMRRARDAFGRALALDPGFSPAREHAGDLLVVSNDTAGARRADEAAARDSTNLFAGARAFFAARSDAERRAVLDRLAVEGPRPFSSLSLVYRIILGTGREMRWVDTVERRLARSTAGAPDAGALGGAYFEYEALMIRGRPQAAARAAPQVADANALLDALLWDGDAQRAAQAFATTAPVVDAGVPADSTARRRWLHAAFDVTLWRLANGDTTRVGAAVAGLQRLVLDARADRGERDRVLLVLAAQRAAVTQAPDAAARLASLDSMLALGPDGLRPGRVGTLVAARLFERAGNLARAERALARWPPVPWDFALTAALFTTSVRERGRLAERLGRPVDALRFYRHYLGLREHAEPAVRAADAEVRAAVARLRRVRKAGSG